MSSKKEMTYLEGDQRLRNKDYVTIPRHQYDTLLSYKKIVTDSKEEIKAIPHKLFEREVALKRRQRALDNARYEIHLRIKKFASEIMEKVTTLETFENETKEVK